MNEDMLNGCPECGAGLVVGQGMVACEGNKYLSRNGAGDCRWEYKLTPEDKIRAATAATRHAKVGKELVERAFASARAELRKTHSIHPSDCFGALCYCAEPVK